MGFDRMSQWLVDKYDVPIPSTNALPLDEAASLQILNDPLHGSLGDPNPQRHFSQNEVRF
jgi:hypothetical protein